MTDVFQPLTARVLSCFKFSQNFITIKIPKIASSDNLRLIKSKTSVAEAKGKDNGMILALGRPGYEVGTNPLSSCFSQIKPINAHATRLVPALWKSDVCHVIPPSPSYRKQYKNT